MKQIQIAYRGLEDLRKETAALREKYKDKTMMINVFFDKTLLGEVGDICSVLDSELPGAEYFGCSTNANIENGSLVENSINLVITVFDDSSAKVEVVSYDLDTTDKKALCDDLTEKVSQRGWVKGIELLITIKDPYITYICERLSQIDEKIEVFGGGAHSGTYRIEESCVFSKTGGFTDNGAVFALIGSDALSIKTVYVSGWRPLGREMRVTKAVGNRLYELDGIPAYDVYRKYMNIDNDEYFVFNALEFPLSYERGEDRIMRVPVKVNDDGSMQLASDIDDGAISQICYGDPQSIIRSITMVAYEVADFSPEAIMLFDCASRRSYWGNTEIANESLPFDSIADTAGFYTSGEFLRSSGHLNQHNVTLVITAMKEGEGKPADKNVLVGQYSLRTHHLSMVRRLADFIGAATKELEEANRQLALANERLSVMATTDELTGLLNRRALKDKIVYNVRNREPFALLMFDLDNFKMINDTFGHDEGDEVLAAFARVLTETVGKCGLKSDCARWGGEEFMVMITGADIDVACESAEAVRLAYAEMDMGEVDEHTVSCGVTEIRTGESVDDICTRVDMALYCSKNAGRNRTSAM